MSGELSRKEWLIRGAIKTTGKLALGCVATVVLVGAPLPAWVWRRIDEKEAAARG